MRKTPVMVYCEGGRYRIGLMANGAPSLLEVEIPAEAGPERIAERLAAAIPSLNEHRRCPVVLAVPSMDCLVAPVVTEDLPRKNKRLAMLYRMEEQLPVPAEELSVDFIERDGRALGVAVQTERWAPLRDALERAGVAVAAVSPMALLAVDSDVPRSAVGDAASHEACDLLLWQDGPRLEMFFFTDGRLVHWYVIPAEMRDLTLVLSSRIISHAGPLRVAVRAIDAPLLQRLGELPGLQMLNGTARDAASQGLDLSLLAAAVVAAGQVIIRHRPAIVDLRFTSESARRASSSLSPLQSRALVAAMACCLCIAAGFLWRGTRYTARAEAFEDENRAIFQQVFPGTEIPVGIASRLRSTESELRDRGASRLSGVVGPPVLALLHNVLARLPTEIRCRWTAMQFDPGAVNLEGEVLHHADAGVIAGALRKALGSFTVDEPQTRQLDGGVVSFTITAAIPRKSDGEEGTP